jgi:hypothetical protein
MVVVMAAAGWGSTGSDTMTISDTSGGGNWTNVVTGTGTGTNHGAAIVGAKYFSSAPGAITVSVAYTMNGGAGQMVTVKVVTGSSTVTGQSATKNNSTASSDFTVAVTPTGTGSWVYGVSDCSASSTNTQTANGSTTTSQNVANATDSVTYSTWRSTSTTTAGTPVTVGTTCSGTSDGAVAALEIMLPQNYTQTVTDSSGLTDNSTNVLTSPPPPVVATITYRGDVVVAPA